MINAVPSENILIACWKASQMFSPYRICTGVRGGGGGGKGACAPPLLIGNGMFVPPPPPPPHTLLTPHLYFPLELCLPYITLTDNYLAIFIYQLIILWTI